MLEALLFPIVLVAILYLPKLFSAFGGWAGLLAAILAIGVFMTAVLALPPENTSDEMSAVAHMIVEIVFAAGYGFLAIVAVSRNALRLKRGVFPISFKG